MIPNWSKEIPDQYKTQEMCNEVVRSVPDPEMLEFVPDQYKTQEMCNEAVQRATWMLEFVPDQCKMQKMCNEAVQINPWMLEFVPDQYKTQKMCNEVVRSVPDPEMLEHVPDQFVILQEMLYEEFIDDDVFITWYKRYKQRKAQKSKIKKELMLVGWHPDRWWNWCVPEDEKKELEKYLT